MRAKSYLDSGKSHVGLGFSVCPVCGIKHDEVVLLNMHLRNSLRKDNFMGWSMCVEHKKLELEYVALVEVSNTTQPTLENAIRTGVVAHVRREAWPIVFNSKVPNVPMVFVECGVVDKLNAMIPHEESPKAIDE